MANPSASAARAANASTATTTSSIERPRSRLNEAALLINRGGLGNGHAYDGPPSYQQPLSNEVNSALDLYASQFLPSGSRSLAGIALRSFCLGAVLALSTLLAVYLIFVQNALWRAPFFLLSLATFHFLEFYTTALANTSDAKVSSFLLMSNGPAYAIAHASAFLECILSHTFHPSPLLPRPLRSLILLCGLVCLVLGQAVRAVAMISAGANFSHVVAHHKRSTHELVTTGVYSVFRHPSYFGFFWWGLGTQMVCGNLLCFLVYAVALWRFFQRRIEGEEELLLKFFGDRYVTYRQRTFVGIPFIA